MHSYAYECVRACKCVRAGVCLQMCACRTVRAGVCGQVCAGTVQTPAYSSQHLRTLGIVPSRLEPCLSLAFKPSDQEYNPCLTTDLLSLYMCTMMHAFSINTLAPMPGLVSGDSSFPILCRCSSDLCAIHVKLCALPPWLSARIAVCFCANAHACICVCLHL